MSGFSEEQDMIDFNFNKVRPSTSKINIHFDGDKKKPSGNIARKIKK